MKITFEEQKQYNLSIIREGLGALVASSTDQLRMNKDGLPNLDDIFDPMPIDYLPWLVDEQIIEQGLSSRVLKLYKEIEEETGSMNYGEEEKYISNESSKLKVWRATALKLINEFKSA